MRKEIKNSKEILMQKQSLANYCLESPPAWKTKKGRIKWFKKQFEPYQPQIKFIDINEYERLPFEQYFIDTSRGEYGGTPSIHFDYDEIDYKSGFYRYHAFYKVLYNEERQLIQIYFKETTDKTGWRANFDFFHKYYDSFQYKGKDIQLKTAKGWGQMYNSMKWYIRTTVEQLFKEHGSVPLEIIGWSLGSAIAQLCAQDLYFNYGLRAHIYTFGSVKPWFGMNNDMRQYLSECYIDCYNFGDINDIVIYQVPLPRYFKLNDVKVAQDDFCLFRLFKPMKYHTEYWKKELYENIF